MRYCHSHLSLFRPPVEQFGRRHKTEEANYRVICASRARWRWSSPLWCLRVKMCHRNHTRSRILLRLKMFLAAESGGEGGKNLPARLSFMQQRKRDPTSLMQILDRRRCHVAGGGSATAEVANNGQRQSEHEVTDGHRISRPTSVRQAGCHFSERDSVARLPDQ